MNVTTGPFRTTRSAFFSTIADNNKQAMWVTIGVSAFFLLLLIAIMFFMDVSGNDKVTFGSSSFGRTTISRLNSKPPSIINKGLRANSTPFNMVLLIEIASNCTKMIFQGLVLFSNVPSLLFYFLGCISTSIYIMTAIYCSWIRGYPIFELVLESDSLKCCRATFITFGVFTITPNFPVLLLFLPSFASQSQDLTNMSNILFDVIGSLLIFADIVVVVCYHKYLSRVQSDGYAVNFEEIRVLSKFGIASCVVQLLWPVSHSAMTVMNWNLNMATQGAWYIFWSNINNYAPLIFIALQFSMKWCLLRVKIKEKHDRANRMAKILNDVVLGCSATLHVTPEEGENKEVVM